MSHNRARAGFNLIEVIACVMIVAGSLAIGVSLLSSAIRIGGENRIKTVAVVTGLTVAYDPGAGKKIHPPSKNGRKCSYYDINGFYVERESSEMFIPPDKSDNTFAEFVTVRVYDASSYETTAGNDTDVLFEYRLWRLTQKIDATQ